MGYIYSAILFVLFKFIVDGLNLFYNIFVLFKFIVDGLNLLYNIFCIV